MGYPQRLQNCRNLSWWLCGYYESLPRALRRDAHPHTVCPCRISKRRVDDYPLLQNVYLYWAVVCQNAQLCGWIDIRLTNPNVEPTESTCPVQYYWQELNRWKWRICVAIEIRNMKIPSSLAKDRRGIISQPIQLRRSLPSRWREIHFSIQTILLYYPEGENNQNSLKLFSFSLFLFTNIGCSSWKHTIPWEA